MPTADLRTRGYTAMGVILTRISVPDDRHGVSAGAALGARILMLSLIRAFVFVAMLQAHSQVH